MLLLLLERGLRTVKTHLTTLMKVRKTGKSWIAHLDEVISHYNSLKAFKTSYPRISINAGNFYAYLNERYGVDDVTMSFSSSSLDIRAIPIEAWKNKLFRFRLGARVLLSASGDYRIANKGFYKKTTSGTYGAQVYEIAGAKLRKSSDGYLVAG